MSGATGIEWTQATWNPTKGCDRVSPGCDHCYALTMAKRLKGMGQPEYQLDGDPRTSGPGFLAHESPRDLDWPTRRRKPLRIFVNSMSDLFHENISDEFLCSVFDVMANTPRHTYQVLTKRHARMRSFVTKYTAGEFGEIEGARPVGVLPNVWLGVSVENQQWETIRGDALRETPAAVRFYSAEPLLGAIQANLTGIDWVIVGGESGPGARPMHPDWARSLRDQCVAARVPFLFKQWGSVAPFGQLANETVADWEIKHGADYPADAFCNVGKKAAGRLLDGRTWDEYPQAMVA